MTTDKENIWVAKKWDIELAQVTWTQVRERCLFACIWKERKEGGYTMSDFQPFIAFKKIVNQGVEAYEGIVLREGYEHLVGRRRIVVQCAGRAYIPVNSLSENDDRLMIFKDPDEVIPIFLNRFAPLKRTLFPPMPKY